MTPTPPLRVTLVAMTVGPGMRECVQLLGEALAPHCRVTVIAPAHFNEQVAGATQKSFVTGRSPRRAMLRALDPFSHARLLAAIRAQPADVIHLYNGHGYPWALSLAALRGRTPLLTTLHDPEPHPGNRTDAVSFRLGAFTLAYSQAIQVHDPIFVPQLAARYPGKIVAALPLGSLAGRYTRFRRPGIGRARDILFFGRIEYYKGIEILLRAMALLPADIGLTIAGNGALSPTERKLIADLGPRVRLLNRFVEEAEAANLLQASGVLAMPYRQATQSSLPQIAQAFGIPMVASAVGTFSNEVPMRGGVSVPAESPTALAAAILAQLDAPRAMAQAQTTFEDLVPRYLELYQRIRQA